MEMTPQMLEILKKAKQIDKAARKFDTGASKKSTTSGLMDSVGGINEDYTPPIIKKDINSESYSHSVKNSKLPAAIQKAMLENPIPQGDFIGVDENAVRELRSLDEDFSYDEKDEVDMYEKPVRRSEKKRVIKENFDSESINVDEKYLRQLIASEITKALPKIIENYFDNRLVKENVQFKAGSTIFSGTVMPMPKVKGKNNI